MTEVPELPAAANARLIERVDAIRDATQHPHLKERGYIVELEHPVIGRLSTLGAPVLLPDAPGGPKVAAPLLGQQTEAVMCGRLGLSEIECQELRQAGTI